MFLMNLMSIIIACRAILGLVRFDKKCRLQEEEHRQWLEEHHQWMKRLKE
jgi:hypothetical protein